MSLRVFPWGRVILVSDPGHIAAVFASPHGRFHAGEGNRILAPVFGRHSLITSDGDEHRRLRRLMAPMFGGAAVRGYRETVRAMTEHELRGWPERVPFRTMERVRGLSFDIIWRILLGPDGGRRHDRLRTSLRRLPMTDVAVLMGLNHPCARRLWPWRNTVRLLREIDALLYRTIRERRAAPDLRDRVDILSRLITAGDAGDRLSDTEIRDQIVTLLFAGHETTATTLAWALHELARAPEAARNAARAARSGDTGYLEAVVKETLRRRPPVFEATWTLTEDVELDGYRLPRGATLMPLLGIVHMDPANYPAPGDFRPERFLGDAVPPHAFIPFGGGARRCIGAQLSMIESVEVLRVLLSRRGVTTDRPAPEAAVFKHVTLSPAGGARVLMTPAPGTIDHTPAEGS
ncbi:cytochrome P450 [Streptomyces sp. CA-181903]|uniref:cytochrome P450 n=1 Tax=Streptomyces sp. CA-181903 TaxID=3240055 RepID=UPI003D8C0006